MTPASLPKERILPRDIFEFLSERIFGQDDILKRVSVSVYKHMSGVKGEDFLLIGNSGTGKTSIMRAVQAFYHSRKEMEKYRTMAIMNANTLVDENGEVNLNKIFKNVELAAKNVLGEKAEPAKLKEHMECATVCFDEIDKIAAKTAGSVNVTGITIQQALLTVFEGEEIVYDAYATMNGDRRKVRFALDTSHMLFLCGGAFDGLYEQVYLLVKNEEDERRLGIKRTFDEDNNLTKTIDFDLKRLLKLTDLFEYGMIPQFLSRFSSISVLSPLDRKVLERILLTSPDSPLLNARRYFQTMGVDLELNDEALDLIVRNAAKNTRIGARALREVFSRVVAEMEFDPLGSEYLAERDGRKIILIDRQAVQDHLAR